MAVQVCSCACGGGQGVCRGDRPCLTSWLKRWRRLCWGIVALSHCMGSICLYVWWCVYLCVWLSGVRVRKAFFGMEGIRGEWRGLGRRADGVHQRGGLRNEKEGGGGWLMDKSPFALSQERCDMERLCGGCQECMGVCSWYWRPVRREEEYCTDREHTWGRSNCVVSVGIDRNHPSWDSNSRRLFPDCGNYSPETNVQQGYHSHLVQRSQTEHWPMLSIRHTYQCWLFPLFKSSTRVPNTIGRAKFPPICSTHLSVTMQGHNEPDVLKTLSVWSWQDLFKALKTPKSVLVASLGFYLPPISLVGSFEQQVEGIKGRGYVG